MEAIRKEVICPHIRWMVRRDMKEILDIENACHQYPWQEEEFVRVLRQRNCIGMAAEHNGLVVGFMVYALHLRHLHILNLAVAPIQRRGIGTAMIGKLKDKLDPDGHRRTRLVAEVRETNLDALHFLKANGFIATELLHGFYDSVWTDEDAIRMEYWH